eukprot:GEMP01092474.1.p1 GENE.GEMP01092474.1~~GEMP01092474.1.p1  ORF type:complete len:123 (+),score=15.75 GEMP01092474.1:52-369(+)
MLGAWVPDGQLRPDLAGILDCRRAPKPLPFVVPICIEEFRGFGGARWCELPPRHLTLAVVVDTEEDKLLVEDRLSDWILEVSISPELTAAPSKSALPHTLWRPTP